MPQLPILIKRVLCSNIPIPFDHPLTIPTFIVMTTFSILIYYYLQVTNTATVMETTRRRSINKRRQLERPEDRFASLKVGKMFVNPFEEWQNVAFLTTALFWLRRWKGNGLPKTQKELEQSLPVHIPALDTIFSGQTNEKTITTDQHGPNSDLSAPTDAQRGGPAKDSVTFTWFGQSTCLITIDGLAILTDPVFSRCSINDYLGPKRLRPIPCPLKDFEKDLDIVLVSHDHFDHLDEKVVYQLGDSVTWYIPLGLRGWFLKRKVSNVVEMDWWQEIRHQSRPDITIACVPAMHWSGSRTPFEKNGTLWGSYVVKGQENSIFFCGDTGYSPELFKAIGDIYAPFTLAAIPIGSFKPEPMMQHVHMGPEDAIRAHIDLKMPRLSVGIHWGTFMMSDEHYLEPPTALARLWKKELDQQPPSFVTSTRIDSTLISSSLPKPDYITTHDSSPASVHCDDQPYISNSSSSTTSSSEDTLGEKTASTLYPSQFVTTAFGETVVLS